LVSASILFSSFTSCFRSWFTTSDFMARMMRNFAGKIRSNPLAHHDHYHNFM
jgi:hypothetical protein